MKKISKADLPIKELVELIKEDFIKTDKLIKNQITIMMLLSFKAF